MIHQSVTLFVVLAVVLGGVSAIQPGCRTRYELRMKWAVQGSNSGYWECAKWGRAQLKTCPSDTLFSAPYQTCVPAKYWEKFPYYAPPTTVNDFADECTEEPETCINPCDVECNGGTVDLNGVCRCPPHLVLKNGTCVIPIEVEDCRDYPNTYWDEDEERCLCVEDHVNVDGECVMACTDGTWDELGQTCICQEGYQLVNGVCTPSLNGRCDGATDEQHAAGTMDCSPIVCNEELWLNGTLYPTRNPRAFYQCEPDTDTPTTMPCGLGTCFSFAEQVCVHAWAWQNECQ